MWKIKGEDNQLKATVGSLEYNGEWMGESYVTVTVESPAPVNFEIGDYLIYRDERFEINYNPGKIKSAPRYEKGDAFKYENIKFNSLADELTRCDFRDLVLQDNNLHFTGLPKFPFYGGVRDLANRIQANLDKLYTGANKWTVIVSPEFQDDKELNVQIDNIKVQGALEILVNQFETYYTISGRTITIGAAGIPAGHLFKYGKGNGLYEIEQNAEADQAIVTRVRAYGSTRNLPHRYYNSLSGADGQKLIPDNMAVQNLMLPEFPYTTQDPYIDSPNVAKLGIREGTVFFDGSGELEEIYPSIEGMTAEQLKAAGVPCNSTGALDEIVSAEQMTDNGVGEINEGETQTTAKPPTFKVTLKDLGFDINDHLTTETATLSFKTGMLGGRDFEIVGCKKIESGGKVTGYELELNRVYDDSIKLWFPYSAYNAQAGDKFVLLYIEMPEVYIKAAAQRLKDAATEWLSKNDYSRSIYAPKVDEIFMARQHDLAMASGGKIKSLHDTLKEGMLLLFEDEDLNIDASIFIDRLTIKEEGAVPTYEVVLKEEKTVGRLDKMQNQIDSLVAGKGQGGGGYTAAQIRSMIDAYGSTRFLSKLKDDRSQGQIASDKAIEVGDFLAGVSGAKIGKDAETGQTFGEMDRLFIRIKAYFETLTIINADSLAGEQRITPGGGVKCTSVEVLDDVYRCYFLSEQDGEKTETKIVAGDQAIAQMFNAKTGTSNKVSNHRYWRLVTAVSNDAYTDNSGNRYGYIDLSKTDCEKDSDMPQAGDTIVQFGNRTDRTRQAAMVFSTVDADAPSVKLLTGIDSYTLAGKDIVSYGYDPVKGNAYFNCYGDTYIGDPDGSTFIRYDRTTKQLDIKAKLSVQSTIGDKNINDYITGLIPELKQEDIKGFVDAIVDPKIEGIQNQIDGVIETWFYNGVPTLGNYPANGWNTDALKIQHLGDLYYDNDTGTAYRFSQNTQGGYYWNTITDDAITKALAAAQKAQDTADGKRRIFTSQPTAADAYDAGDLWVNATYGTQYSNDLLRCVTSKAAGAAFNISHWTRASKYTDDSALNAFISGYQQTIKDIETQIDGKAQTWYQSTNPATAWTTAEAKAEHKGDLWYCTTDIAGTNFKKDTTWYWNGTSWVQQNIPQSVFDTIDGKASIFISKPTTGYKKNDLWFLEADYTLSGVAYKSGTLVVAKNDMGAAWSANDWVKKDRYTDDTLAQQAKDAADNAQKAADNAKADAKDAKDRLDSWAADGVISPTEKQGIKDEIAHIDGDKAHITAEYARYELGTPTAYNSAYTAYRAQLVALSAATPENIAIPSTFAANQTTYYNQRTTALGVIADAAKKYADAVAKEEAQKAVAGYEYLKKAMADVTTIAGGLMLSSQIRLGEHNEDFTTQTTWSGMNGVYGNGRTIAAWYGGDMLDYFDANDNRLVFTQGKRPAASLIRMDGSAYFAKGNIGFRADGSGWLGNDLTGIKFSKDGGMTFGSGVTFDVANINGLQTTLNSLANFNIGLRQLLAPCDTNGNEISWEEASQSDGAGGIKAKSLKAKVGFWSPEYMSVKGNNPGAGTTTGGGVDLDAVRDYLTQQGYATQQWVNQQGYLKAADLSAYALADNAYLKNQQNRKSNAHTVASLTAVANSSDSWVNNYSLSLVNNNNALNFYVGGVVNERQALIQSGHSSNGYAQVLGVLHLNKLGGAVYINNSLALNAANVGSYAVTLDTEQTISGKKTFTAAETAVNRRLYVNGAFDAFDNYPHCMWHVAGTKWTKAVMDTNGHIHFVEGGASGFTSYKSIKALAFVVAGGTASQILLADGSVGNDLAYMRYRGATSTAGESTLWAQIGVKTYQNALPDGLSGVYAYGEAISFASGAARFDMYVNHFSSGGQDDGRGIHYRSGWNTDKRPWQLLLDTNNYASVLDGRYVHGNYIGCGYGTPTLQWTWGSNLTHVVGFEGANNGAMRVYSGEAVRAFANAVNKAGDTMTGALHVPTLHVHGSVNSNAFITADSASNIFVNAGGNSLMCWVGTEKVIRSAMALAGQVSLGTSAYRWANVYTNTINVTSTALVSNLNADLLDGCHASDFIGNRPASWTNGETVVAWAKRIAGSNPAIYNEANWGWATAKTLTLGSYSIDSQRYAALDFRRGNLNNVWQQKAIMFLPTHSDASMIYIAQMTVSDTAGAANLNAVRRYATYDTILASNVASATKLQTARKIYGVDFDGTADVNGAFFWDEGDATLRIYGIVSAVNSAYGRETVGIQSCFDGEDPQTSSYVTSYYDRCLIALQPRGGRVAIGKTSADFPLVVGGDIMAEGWVRTTGARGWYNQTYGGGWHMDNSTWIKAYNKPVYIGYAAPEGPASFGVGLRLYNSAYTSLEVQGGSYTMGLGCHSDGRWYWWRGTASGKGYVMQYDGTLWSFIGEIKSSVGMYSDGYMSCLGKNTGSDERLKSDFRPLTLSIETILNAPCGTFVWNGHAGDVMCGRRAVGTIAQYWLEHLTEVVGTMPTGYYGVNYGTLDWVAIHSVAKYAKTEIELLKDENRQLKSRIAELERRVAA